MTPSEIRTEQPFWQWRDLLFFIALILPAALATAGLHKALRLGAAGRESGDDLLLMQFILYALLFGSLFLLLRLRYPGQPLLRGLGYLWSRPGVLVSFFAGPPLALAVAVLGSVLRARQIDLPVQDLLKTPGKIALLFCFAVILGPVCEELAFRGLLLPLMVHAVGVWPGILTTALAFALMHGVEYQWSWQHLLLLTVAACAFGWARYRSGSLVASTLMHASYNAFFFMVLLMHEGLGKV